MFSIRNAYVFCLYFSGINVNFVNVIIALYKVSMLLYIYLNVSTSKMNLNIQPSKTRSAFGNADLNADLSISQVSQSKNFLVLIVAVKKSAIIDSIRSSIN
jgi:hypothetical protein